MIRNVRGMIQMIGPDLVRSLHSGAPPTYDTLKYQVRLAIRTRSGGSAPAEGRSGVTA